MANNNEYFKKRTRVGGSGFTIFTFGGQPITFCQEVEHTSPKPVGQGFAEIHPMDEPYPVEIVTVAAATAGFMVLNLIELWGTGGSVSKVWDRLGASLIGPNGAEESTKKNPLLTTEVGNEAGYLTPAYLEEGEKKNGPEGGGVFSGLADIVDIFIKQAELEPGKMEIVKYIRPLPTEGGEEERGGKPYYESYKGCMITEVVDGERVEVGTLQIIKQITVGYRWVERNGKPNYAFKIRDNAL